jgi:uncharacterized damage-inducible protein DinB
MYQDALTEIKSVRDKTLGLIQDLDQSELDRSPSSGKWSIGEILDHLVLTDDYYQKDVSELIDRGKKDGAAEINRTFGEFDVAPRFLPKSFMAFTTPFLSVTNCLLPRFVREAVMQNAIVPFQNPNVVQPRKNRKSDSLKSDLNKSMTRIEKLLTENSDLPYDRLIHNHPILGKNTIPQLLKLMARHEQRHQSQIEGILGK